MHGFAPTCFLFHGPLSKDAAYKKAAELGQVEASYGEQPSDTWSQAHKGSKYNGLAVEEARELVALLPVAMATYTPVYVVGPLDKATVNACDALLKRLEDMPPHSYAVLWAWNLGEVIPTIISRTRPVWSPDPDSVYPPDVEDLLIHASGAVTSWDVGDIAGACMSTLNHGKKDPIAWLHAVAADLPRRGTKAIPLWQAIRAVLDSDAPQWGEVMGVWVASRHG